MREGKASFERRSDAEDGVIRIAGGTGRQATFARDEDVSRVLESLFRVGRSCASSLKGEGATCRGRSLA